MSADRWLGVAAAIYGLLGVAAGAFGAHALEARLSPKSLAVWETAVRYQLVHALAMLAALWLASTGGGTSARFAAAAFAAGILLFSGSLYGLALGGPRILGPVTPLGGVLFLAGWSFLAWGFITRGSAS